MLQSLQDTWVAMEEVYDKGLARSIGVSNQSPEKLERWFKDARVKPAVNQVWAVCMDREGGWACVCACVRVRVQEVQRRATMPNRYQDNEATL